jgi:hypothetical protein
MARNLSVTQFQQLMARIPAEVSRELQGAVDDAGAFLAGSMQAKGASRQRQAG